MRQGQVVHQQYVLRPKSCESAIAESLRSASCCSCFNDQNSLSQEHTMAAKPWTRLESHQSTSAISSCCFEEVPNKQCAFSALSDFYVNTFGRALIDNIGKAFVSSPMRCTGWKVCSSHPPMPSLRLGRSFVFQPAAGLRQEELQIPVPWRNQTQRFGRDHSAQHRTHALPALPG